MTYKTGKVVLFTTKTTKLEGCEEITWHKSLRHDVPDFKMIQLQMTDEYDDITFTMLEPIGNCRGALKQLEQSLLEIPTNCQYSLLVDALEIIDHDSTRQFGFERIIFPSMKIQSRFDIMKTLSDNYNMSRVFVVSEESKENSTTSVIKSNVHYAAISTIDLDHNHNLNLSSTIGYSRLSCSIYIQRPFLFLVRKHKVPIMIGHFVSSTKNL